MIEVAARFWPKVAIGSEAECWPWQGHTAPNGYGRFHYQGKVVYAHRMAYMIAVGPIPEGLTVDHLCHDPASCVRGWTCPHRPCVNWRHLEAVEHGENVRRGVPVATHCPKGHPWDEANTHVRPRSGKWDCRACARERMRSSRSVAVNRGILDTSTGPRTGPAPTT